MSDDTKAAEDQEAPTKPSSVTRPGLRHAYAGLKTEAFFKHIDECGGWPLEYPYVGFAHSDKREAAFTMEPRHDGWWTTLNHRDDYLMWKLSPDAWDRIFEAIRDDLSNRLRNQGPLYKGPSVRDWRRHPAPLDPALEARAAAAIAKKAGKF